MRRDPAETPCDDLTRYYLDRVHALEGELAAVTERLAVYEYRAARRENEVA